MKNLRKQLINILIRIQFYLIDGIKRLIYAKVNWLKIIYVISYKKIFLFYFAFFCIGRMLLYFNPIRFDWVHQIVLSILSFMAIFSLKYAYSMTQKIKNASCGLIYKRRTNALPNQSLEMITVHMINIQNSIWWLIIMLVPAIKFIKKNLYLGFIEKTPAGYYALLFAASTYYIALLGYSQIGIALIQFIKISHDIGGCIHLDFPDDMVSPPEWLSLWNQLFQKIIKIFFIVGTLFTLEYVLLMPKDIITIENNSFTLNVCDAKAFLKSWIVIFLFIIIAFPLLSYIIRKEQKLLIQNLSKKINLEYKTLYSNDESSKSVLGLWLYKQLMETSIQYDKYIHTSKSIIPIISTMLSFLLNIIKLYESLLTPLLGRI